ncbi:MAG: CoA pyrophosphatase [Chloroflexi bacterium]|nr:CoA pyrophosphatase [Chloroflexota bacterium]
MSVPLEHLTETEIAARLSGVGEAQPESPFPPGFLKPFLRRASVLIPFLPHDDGWHLLYIRRTANHNDPHSGQVAFPGGGWDDGDDGAIAAALREAHEEVGIDPAHVRILGRLHDFATITSYLVTPVIGFVPWPYPLRLQTREVSRAFTIPLRWLADPANRRQELRRLPPPFKPVPVIYYQNYDDELLWGVTARLTLSLIEKLTLPE